MTDSSPRVGISVRTRITAALAVLTTLALAGAGLIVYFIEIERIDASVRREVEQELDEFARLEANGVDPRTGESFANTQALLRTFMLRNVPDDDELLVGWVEGKPAVWSPDDALVADPVFTDVVGEIARKGGTLNLETEEYGDLRITSQPVSQEPGAPPDGALLVVAYLDEDRGELVDTMRTYTIVALLSLVAVATLGWWQAGRLLSPLRMLRRAAEEIGATDLSRRVPERGNDDLTALTRTVNGMLDRLESAFAGQRRFLDDAGHELKTPLTILQGHLELLDPDDPAETAATRALLLDEVDRMARLVNDLILLAKSGRPDFLTPAEVDPAELTATVVAKARALGDRRWVDDTASTVSNGKLVLDEQRLTQALLQLADNAVKHTAADAEIGIGWAPAPEQRAAFWVRDTGQGVRPEDRERIFNRFERARVRPGDEGFGLGLSIVSAIARAHGGRVYVDDGPGGGARFVVELPTVRAGGAASHARDTQEVPWPAS